MNTSKYKKIHTNYKNLVRYINLLLKKNRLKTIFAFIAMIIVSILSLIQPKFIQLILDEAILNKNITLLIKTSILYFSTIIITVIINIILDYFYSKTKKRVSTKLKNTLLNHLSKMSGSYFTDKKTGELLRILDSDIFLIEDFGMELFFSTILSVFTAILSLVFLINIEFKLTIIVVILEIIIIFIQLKFTKKIATKTHEIRNIAGESTNKLEEYISNIMNIVISKSKLLFFKNYIKTERRFINKSLKLDVIISFSSELLSLLNDLIIILIYMIGGIKIINKSMTIGELLAFTQYTNMLISPCSNLINSNRRIQQTIVSINKVFDILDEPIKISQNNLGNRDINKFNGVITFKNVDFSYNTDSVISNVNLKFNNGEITALVGNSGCGKSTIVRLIYRLWDVSSGDILIDNYSIKSYNLNFLRKNISIISQDIVLFNDTILNNIKLNTNVTTDYVYKICEKVGISNFIDNLENGYDTVIGERGIKLSGGQRQRIAIARALLDGGKIIIFDEATSALDNISQSSILNNIKDILYDKTVIIIAHRLVTIKDADKIFVMDNGKVVESGNHKELIKNKKYYYELLKKEK